jgi:hypothetical protein
MTSQIRIKPKKLFVECLLCSKDIYVGNNPHAGKFITCKNCEMIFEIINIDPVLIDWPFYDDEEDFDDDMDDYYNDWS